MRQVILVGPATVLRAAVGRALEAAGHRVEMASSAELVGPPAPELPPGAAIVFVEAGESEEGAQLARIRDLSPDADLIRVGGTGAAGPASRHLPRPVHLEELRQLLRRGGAAPT